MWVRTSVFMCVSICCKVCVLKCMQEGADTDGRRLMSGPRADTGSTIHQGGGWIRDTAEKEMREKRKKKRDPTRGVTLPNHPDGGKARSDSQGSSDSRRMNWSQLN